MRLLFALASLALSALAQPPIRVLLVTGGHDHDIAFYSVFDDPRFRVTVDGHPSAFRRDFRDRYDVLVMYDSAEIDEAKQKHVRAFVDAGKGVVVLHHAICSNRNWLWWGEEVVGGRWRFAPETPPTRYSHDERIHVRVAKRHPVTEGVGEFTIRDETYQDLWISPKVEVLLTTEHPKSDRAVAWLGRHPSARVVYLQFGHDAHAHRDPNYIRLVRNAVAWSGAP
jgi:type 1 glutamine amidotransferase